MLIGAVEQIGQRLLATAPEHSFDFRFHVLRDASINAFAAPGGVVVVHTGLLVAAESPDEVAGVLAHEIAHVLETPFDSADRLPTRAAHRRRPALRFARSRRRPAVGCCHQLGGAVVQPRSGARRRRLGPRPPRASARVGERPDDLLRPSGRRRAHGSDVLVDASGARRPGGETAQPHRHLEAEQTVRGPRLASRAAGPPPADCAGESERQSPR